MARVITPKDTLADFLSGYREALSSKRKRTGKGLSAATLREYTAQLKRVEQDLGALALAAISRRDVTQFLEQFPATYRNRYRSLLHGMFAHAVAEGRRDDNPVDGTLKATEVVRRPRLTMPEFIATYRRAPDWLRRAMSLGLRTLQRRTDIVTWTYEDNVDGDYLLVVQQKTGAHLRIRMTRHIRKAVGRGSKWLVQSNGKPVSADMLTKGFARCRPSGCQATFHEIRALGARLLEQQGVNPQALLGHADPKMTRVYLDRHATKWIEVNT